MRLTKQFSSLNELIEYLKARVPEDARDLDLTILVDGSPGTLYEPHINRPLNGPATSVVLEFGFTQE